MTSRYFPSRNPGIVPLCNRDEPVRQNGRQVHNPLKLRRDSDEIYFLANNRKLKVVV